MNQPFLLSRSLAAVSASLLGFSALAHGQAFTGTFNLAGTTNEVASFAYNGSAVANLTVSSLSKVGITSTSSTNNFRGSNWPIGTVDSGPVDTAKYIEFTLTAGGGKVIDLPSITFGVGRSATGPRQWQWRSSVDAYSSPIPVTTVTSGLTHSSGVLTNPDANSSWTANEIITSGGAYQGLSSVTFRLYGYNTEAAGGTGGIQGNLTFGGTLSDGGGDPVITLSTDSPSYSEDAGETVGTLTATRTGSTSGALEISLSADLASDVNLPATITIPDTQPSATVSFGPVDDGDIEGDEVVTITGTASGFDPATSSFTILNDDLPPVATSALINEYAPNPQGTDASTQIVEVSGPPSTTASLWVLLIESDEDGSGAGPGAIDRAEQFTVSFDAGGLGQITLNDLENPSNILVLVDEFTGSVGVDLDTDNDGTIDVAVPWTTVLDAIGVSDNAGDAALTAALVTSLGAGNSFAFTGNEPQLVFRDGTSGDWYAINDPDNGAAFDLLGTDVLSGGAMVFDADQTVPTYGSVNPSLDENPNPPLLTLLLDKRQIVEGDGNVISGNVSRPSFATTGTLTVTLNVTSGNAGRVSFSQTTLEIADGVEQADTGFLLGSVSNMLADGDAIIAIEASAPGYTSGQITVAVLDDETPAPTLVINEVLADASGAGGPDFVEIHNAGVDPVDISGYKVVSYLADPNFSAGQLDESIVIPAATILPAGGFYLIGASNAGEPDSVGQVYGVTPDLIVPDFNLDDFDVSISLLDASDNRIFTALIEDTDFDAFANIAGVLVPADIAPGPDAGFGPAGYYLLTDGGQEAGFIEFVANTAQAPSATPGVTNVLEPQLFITADPSSIDEDGGTDSVVFTVTRFPSSNSVGDLTVNLSSSDAGELTVPLTVTILDGDTQASFSGTPQTDGIVDGDQPVTVMVAATDHISGSTDVTVVDIDVALPATFAMLNEYAPNPTGTDPVDTTFEIKGTPSTTSALWILSIETDAGAGVGTIDMAQQFTLNFDVNGLALATIPGFDLENPSHAIVIVDTFTGTTGTDLDSDNDGTLDPVVPWGNVLDALSVPDDTVDATTGANLITSLGAGSAFAFTGTEPQLVFRDGTTGGWFAINDPFAGSVYNLNAVDVAAGGGSFDVPDPSVTTPGAVNPSFTAGGNTFDTWINGVFANTVTDFSTEGTNDNDGPNVLDAFFGTDPTVDDNNTVTAVGKSGSTFTFRHKLAKVTVTDVTGSYEWSTTLGGWIADGAEDNLSTVTFGEPTVVDSTNPDFDIVEVDAVVSGAPLDALFVRINVAGPVMPE